MLPKIAARSASGKVFEPLWRWVLAGRVHSEASERAHYSAYWYWLWAWPTHHWHVCSTCGEGLEERLIRLLKIALDSGVVALTDDDSIVMDDGNVCNVIAALDEIEEPPSLHWWRSHYETCAGRFRALEQLQDSGEAKL
jgi:hypothetical protein